MLFNNGKGRVMGSKASREVVLHHFSNASNIELQSQTYVGKLPHEIDLDKMDIGLYEPELFAARTIRINNVMINLFHNGKVVVMGKNFNESDINRYLYCIFNKC